MAKSIKLGSDTYLDASGVYDVKGRITSAFDLNDYSTVDKAGTWVVHTSGTVANSPSSATGTSSSGLYGMLFVGVYSNTSAKYQLFVNNVGVFYRAYTGNPASWSSWRRLVGAVMNDFAGYAVISDTSNPMVSVPSGTSWTNVYSKKIPHTGRYLVEVSVRFTNNSNGRRSLGVIFSSTEGGASGASDFRIVGQNAVDGNHTYLHLVTYVYINDAEADNGMYINVVAAQTSGSALSVNPSVKLITLS